MNYLLPSESPTRNNQFLQFLIKLGLLTLPALLFFSILRSNSVIQAKLSESFPIYHFSRLIMISAQKILLMIGYDATLAFNRAIYHYPVFSLQIQGGIQTFIGFSCLGLGVMWVFISLIISWPGKIKAKIIFIISGLLMIFTLNVIRMAYLTWLGKDGILFTNKTISFLGIHKYDHHDLFNFFIYIIIFILFILWIEVFSKKTVKNGSDSQI